MLLFTEMKLSHLFTPKTQVLIGYQKCQEYDLKLPQQLNSIIFSWTITHVKWSKETTV